MILPESVPDDEMARLADEIQFARTEITDLEYKTSDVRNYLGDHDRPSSVLDLAQSVNLDDDDYRQKPIRKEVKMDVETVEEVYQVVMKRSHEIDFADERVRDFVYKVLTAQDRRLTRSEVMSMDVPPRGDVIELMNHHVDNLARINALREDFERLQDELILSDIYGLDDGEKEIIEEFLNVW